MIHTLIASRPGDGKTHYAVEFFIKNIANNKNGVFISLEMSDKDLREKIFENININNINISVEIIKNLHITYQSTINSIIDYIENLSESIEFIIIDYLQLLNSSTEFEKLIKYLNDKNISLLMTTQMRKGEVKGQIFTDLLLQIREQNILQFFEEVKFITQKYGIIEFDNQQNR